MLLRYKYMPPELLNQWPVILVLHRCPSYGNGGVGLEQGPPAIRDMFGRFAGDHLVATLVHENIACIGMVQTATEISFCVEDLELISGRLEFPGSFEGGDDSLIPKGLACVCRVFGPKRCP